MKKITNKMKWPLLITGLLAMVGVLSLCIAIKTNNEFDKKGNITDIFIMSNFITIMVNSEDSFVSDGRVIKIDNNTTIYNKNGHKVINKDDLKVGDQIEISYMGPELENNYVQAIAKYIVVK